MKHLIDKKDLDTVRDVLDDIELERCDIAASGEMIEIIFLKSKHKEFLEHRKGFFPFPTKELKDALKRIESLTGFKPRGKRVFDLDSKYVTIYLKKELI